MSVAATRPVIVGATLDSLHVFPIRIWEAEWVDPVDVADEPGNLGPLLGQ